MENHTGHCCDVPAADVHDGAFRRVLWTVLAFNAALFVLARGPRWRTGAALLKGAAMGLFGFWVIGATAWRLVVGGVPNPVVMSAVGVLALAVNVFCAVLLYRFRGG